MLTTAIIAFREFLEAFLLIGIFIGIDKKLKLHKRKEILLASSLGLIISLILPIIVFIFAGKAAQVLTEKNADVLEGYLLTFSGFFLAYVVFVLHEFMKEGKKKIILKANAQMEQRIFDVSLFMTIILFILREGFEVAMLIAATSLFSTFLANIEGLVIGFLTASLIGLATLFTYIELPIKKIFIYTEYFILLIGAAMVKNGVSLLFENYTHVSLEKVLPLSITFLPNDTTIAGHLLKNLTGIQAEMSIVQIILMIGYIYTIKCLFLSKPLAK